MVEKEHIVQKKNELQESMTIRKKDIELLLDFSTGYKKLPDQDFGIMPYQKNYFRLISTIEQIHKQIRELKKEYKLLNKMIKKSKEESNDPQ